MGRYTSDEFKKIAKSGKLPRCIVYGKSTSNWDIFEDGLAVEKDGALTFTISSSNVDRDNDSISIDGWDLTNFKKNPVVLWGHDSSLPPIGRAMEVWADGSRLKAKVDFSPADMPHPLGMGFGHTVARMFSEGFLHATSVGFQPKEFSFNEERGPMAVDFKRQELLEFSAVPIPANPDALIGADLGGEATKDLINWCQLTIDDSKNAWAVDCAKQLHKGLTNNRTIFITETNEVDEALKVVEDSDADTKLLADAAERIAKRGRVLSSGNESKLRDAMMLIQNVIAQVEQEPVIETDEFDLTDEDIKSIKEIITRKVADCVGSFSGHLEV